MSGGTAGGELDEYARAWRALSRRERTSLMRAAGAGRPAGNRSDAALMLWWSSRELRRGPWPGVRLALAFVAGILLLMWAVSGVRVADIGAILAAAPLLPILPLIPLAAFTLRRPRLERAAQQNARMLSGRPQVGSTAPADVDRLLVRARNKGWLKAPRAKG